KIAKQIIQTGEGWTISAQDPFESGLAAYRIAKQTGTKLHLQVHTDLESPYFRKHSLLNRMRVILAHYLLPKADGIRVVSSRIKDSLLSTLHFPLSTSLCVLPVFVDTDKIR